MLIFCTKDQDLINAWINTTTWGDVYVLDAGADQNEATVELIHYLQLLRPQEPLCIAAHGNNNEIGDDGSGDNDWSWSCADIAKVLRLAGPNGGWSANTGSDETDAKVLFQVCCSNVANFSAGVAVALEKNPPRDFSVWCYGYRRSVPFRESIPSPAQLDRNPALQPTWARCPARPRG